MAWRDDVLDVVERLPPTFQLRHVYRFIPKLHREHPENRHIAEKIRQQLQVLRDEGVLEFVEPAGTYRRVVEGGPVLVDELPWTPGEPTTRAAIADLLGMKTPDPLRRGMFRRAEGPYRNHLFLFHDEERNPYGDVVGDVRVRYVGQGMQGDQELSSYNQYLAEHLDRGVKVHLFTQPAAEPGVVRYEGEVVCQDTERVYRPEEDRSVLVFDLMKVEADVEPLTAYGQAFDEILSKDRDEPAYEDRAVVAAASQRLVRDPAFRSIVLEAYEAVCAVCGDPLRSEARSELEAAHIVPVAERGPDEVRNGLSLCVRHHWAFDAGVFTLTDDHRVDLLIDTPDPHDELRQAERIQLPALRENHPHAFYLKHHRSKWAA